MQKIVIEGGARLKGEVRVSGAKNAALPILASAILGTGTSTYRNVPKLADLGTMSKLLTLLGAKVESVDREGHVLRVSTDALTTHHAPYELVKTMRASVLVLGPLVARYGQARVSLPGGCAIGARPINLHVAALEQLGAEIQHSHGYVEARAPQGLKGAQVHFERITVTGTEDVLMAAVLAQGETVISNAAREPEVQDLALLLNKMGASVEGAGTSTIRVRGVSSLHGTEHAIIPDRIEAGTFLIAAAITRGNLVVSGFIPEHVEALASKMRQAGVDVTAAGHGALRVQASLKLRATDITTEEYPGFATDLQAQYMALMTLAEGISFVSETIFENRFMHTQELARMGANIRVEGRQAIVAGVAELTGAQVIASDLRASASLVLAGLVARGETVVDRVYHIDRGYERIEEKLARVGARIERII